MLPSSSLLQAEAAVRMIGIQQKKVVLPSATRALLLWVVLLAVAAAMAGLQIAAAAGDVAPAECANTSPIAKHPVGEQGIEEYDCGITCSVAHKASAKRVGGLGTAALCGPPDKFCMCSCYMRCSTAMLLQLHACLREQCATYCCCPCWAIRARTSIRDDATVMHHNHLVHLSHLLCFTFSRSSPAVLMLLSSCHLPTFRMQAV